MGKIKKNLSLDETQEQNLEEPRYVEMDWLIIYR